MAVVWYVEMTVSHVNILTNDCISAADSYGFLPVTEAVEKADALSLTIVLTENF